MITNSKGVSNNLVNVVYCDKPFPAIAISNRLNGEIIEMFAGIDDLDEMFNDFQAGINENITVKDAISFFKLKII